MMFRILTAAFLLAAAPAWAAWQQINDANSFSSNVVGNSYADADGNWFRFNANGTLDGGSFGRSLTGNWQFSRGMACFNRSMDGTALPSDCIVVLTSGNQLVTVRDQGRGKQTVYTRQ